MSKKKKNYSKKKGLDESPVLYVAANGTENIFLD